VGELPPAGLAGLGCPPRGHVRRGPRLDHVHRPRGAAGCAPRAGDGRPQRCPRWDADCHRREWLRPRGEARWPRGTTSWLIPLALLRPGGAFGDRHLRAPLARRLRAGRSASRPPGCSAPHPDV